MFTGIVEDVGRLESIRRQARLATLTLSSKLPDLRVSQSLAVNGVCLTLVRVQGDRVTVEAARETLQRTTVSDWKSGDPLNLERPLKVGDELGGHFVLGHVDGVERVLSIRSTKEGSEIVFSIRPDLARQVIQKGSIALNGVSLTVNAVDRRSFSVYLIPFTLAHTNLGRLRAGSRVNIETDMLAKHIERLAPGGRRA